MSCLLLLPSQAPTCSSSHAINPPIGGHSHEKRGTLMFSELIYVAVNLRINSLWLHPTFLFQSLLFLSFLFIYDIWYDGSKPFIHISWNLYIWYGPYSLLSSPLQFCFQSTSGIITASPVVLFHSFLELLNCAQCNYILMWHSSSRKMWEDMAYSGLDYKKFIPNVPFLNSHIW